MHAVRTEYISKQKVWVHYFLLILLVGVSSFPILIGDEILVASFLISGLAFVNTKGKFSNVLVKYCLVFFSLFLIHSLVYKQTGIVLVLGYFFRIAFGFFVLSVIRERFFSYFINLMYWISIISLFFYAALLIYPGLKDILLDTLGPVINTIQISESNREHIGIYTFSNVKTIFYQGLLRNAGPFWEPGGFGIFLALALIFHIIQHKRLIDKKTIVLGVTAITTLSTATVLLLFSATLIYAIVANWHVLLKGIVITGMVATGWLVYQDLGFLGEKLQDDIRQGRKGIRSRTGSALVDLDRFKSSPLIGVSMYPSVRFTKREQGDLDLKHRPNGLFALLAEFGLVGILAYVYFMIKPLRAYCIRHGVTSQVVYLIILIILMAGFSQSIFHKPFFLALSIGLTATIIPYNLTTNDHPKASLSRG